MSLLRICWISLLFVKLKNSNLELRSLRQSCWKLTGHMNLQLSTPFHRRILSTAISHWQWSQRSFCPPNRLNWTSPTISPNLCIQEISSEDKIRNFGLQHQLPPPTSTSRTLSWVVLPNHPEQRTTPCHPQPKHRTTSRSCWDHPEHPSSRFALPDIPWMVNSKGTDFNKFFWSNKGTSKSTPDLNKSFWEESIYIGWSKICIAHLGF